MGRHDGAPRSWPNDAASRWNSIQRLERAGAWRLRICSTIWALRAGLRYRASSSGGMASGVMVRERGVCSAGADLLSIRNAVQIVLRRQVVKGVTGRRGPGSVPLGLTLIKAQKAARRAVNEG